MLPECCREGVVGHGPQDARVAIVGIAPGSNEWTAKRPFVGQSGKLLDALLKSVGLSREQVYTTNVYCHVDNKPSEILIEGCRPRVTQELANSKIVVAMGQIACEELFKQPFGRARGAVLYDAIPGKICMATYHPSAILQSGDKPDVQNNLAADLFRDFQKLAMLAKGELNRGGAVRYELMFYAAQAQTLLNSIPQDTLVTVDIETDYDKDEDQSIFDQHILCIGIGFNESYYVMAGAALDVQWPGNVRYMYHNGQFDSIGLRLKYDRTFSIDEDTLLESYTLDERNRKGLHKLKPLAREYVGSDFYEEVKHDTTAPAENLYEYNAKDVYYTSQLHDFFQPRQAEDNVRGVYEELLIPAANMLADCCYEGVPVDIIALIEESTKLEQALESLDQEIKDIVNRDININSPQQVGRFLYEELGFTPSKRTKTGAPSTDKESLQDIDHPFVDAVLRRRMVEKLHTTYALKSLRLLKYDKRLHPFGSVTGTTTGRLAYREPNITTLPKAHTVGTLESLRRIFTVENDDYILVEADYKQIELVVAQALSHDEQMLCDLQEDMHGIVAQDVLKVPWPGHAKDCTCSVECMAYNFARYSAKHINFGALFDESPIGFTRKPPLGIGCSLQEAVTHHKNWYARYHQTAAWKDSIRSLIKTQGEVTTIFGRKRRMPLVLNTRQLRQIVNMPIQSTASDCTLSSAIELWPLLKKLDSRILFLVHDSIVFHVARKHLDDVITLIKDTMQRPRNSELPSIAVELTKGPNLYNMVRI